MAARRQLADRIFVVLDAVRAVGPDASLADLAARAELPKPTVLRIARDLVDRGMLARTAEGYRLGAGLAALGVAAAQQQRMAVLARPHLRQVQHSTGQLVFLTSAAGGPPEVIDVAHPALVSAASAALPWRRPDPDHVGLLCTATGRLVLSADPERAERLLLGPIPRPTAYTTTNRRVLGDVLRRARDEAVVVEHEQYVRGYTCVAAAIQHDDGHLAGIFSVVGRLGSYSPERAAHALSTAAQAVSAGLSSDPATLSGPARP